MNISFECCVIEGDKLIFPVYEYDMLCEYDIGLNCLSIIEGYETELLNDKPKYGSIIKWRDSVILSPLFSSRICVHNVKGQFSRYIDLPNRTDCHEQFFQSCQYNDKIYFFPGNYSYIVEFDPSNDAIREIDINKDCVGYSISRRGLSIADNSIYVPMMKSSYVLRLTDRVEYINPCGDGFSYVSLCCGNDKCLLLLCDDGVVVEWNYENNTNRKLFKVDTVGEYSFSELLYINNKVVVIPFYSNRIVFYDYKTDTVNSISNGNENLISLGAWIWNNNILIYSYGVKQLFIVDLEKEAIVQSVSIDDFNIGKEMDFNMRHERGDQKGVYLERDYTSLDGFLNIVINTL